MLAVPAVALFIGSAYAGETLLYAVTYKQYTHPFRKTTEIFGLAQSAGETRRVFSDAGLPILLLPGKRRLALGGNRLFAYAGQRVYDTGPNYVPKNGPRNPHRAWIYELTIDGGNRYRKVLTPVGEQHLHEIFASPTGGRIAYLNYLTEASGNKKPKTRLYIFVHDTDAGTLLHKLDVTAVCLDCYPWQVIWLDENRLLLRLDVGDEHLVQSQESYKKAGAYVVRADGSERVRLDRALFEFRPAGLRPRRGQGTCHHVMANGELFCSQPVFHGNGVRGNRCSHNFRQAAFALDLHSKSSRRLAHIDAECIIDLDLSGDNRTIAVLQDFYRETKKRISFAAPTSGRLDERLTLDRGTRREHDLFLIGWSRDG